MEWLWILWAIISVITACVAFFLTAIDVLEPEEALVLSVCIIVFPFGFFVLICVSLIKLYNFLNKHKDSIRKFLRIK